jgi:hypothetical protein
MRTIRRNVFTESLPSNGYTRHNIYGYDKTSLTCGYKIDRSVIFKVIKLSTLIFKIKMKMNGRTVADAVTTNGCGWHSSSDDSWIWSTLWDENWQANRVIGWKSSPVVLFLLQIPHYLNWNWTVSAMVGGRQLTSWTTVRPLDSLQSNDNFFYNK